MTSILSMYKVISKHDDRKEIKTAADVVIIRNGIAQEDFVKSRHVSLPC